MFPPAFLVSVVRSCWHGEQTERVPLCPRLLPACLPGSSHPDPEDSRPWASEASPWPTLKSPDFQLLFEYRRFWSTQLGAKRQLPQYRPPAWRYPLQIPIPGSLQAPRLERSKMATVQGPMWSPGPPPGAWRGCSDRGSFLPTLLLSGTLGDGLLLSLNRGEEDSRAHVTPRMWDNGWSFSPGQLSFRRL